MKKTLKDFTPEIQAKIPLYIEKYTKSVFDGEKYHSFKYENAEKLINWNYEKCNYKKPVMLVAENPYEAQIFFNYIVARKEIFTPILYFLYSIKNGLEIPKEFSNFSSQLYSQLDSQLDSQLYSQLYSQLDSQLDSQLYSQLDSQLGKKNPDYLFTTSVYGGWWLGWYKFIKDEFNIEAEINVTLDSWNEMFNEANIYSAIFSELLCIVSKYPREVSRNPSNDLHSTKTSAVNWGYSTELTKWDCCFVNGRNISTELFNKVVNDNFTFDEFVKLKNEDEKGIILTIIKENKGNEGLLKFLNAIEVDKKVVYHANGYSETLKLFKTKEKYSFLMNSKGEENQPYAWIGMVCPSTGTQYLIDTCPTFKDAVECAKWHRPERIPNSIPYIWSSAN